MRLSAATSRSRRSKSIAIVSSERIAPSPWQVGHSRDMISRSPSVTFWRVISTRPSLEDLGGEGLRAILVERLAQRLQHGVAVACARHVDEVDHDDPADVAQAQLP